MKRSWFAAAIAVAAIGAACSSFSGDDATTTTTDDGGAPDGSSSGVVPPPPSDGGSDVPFCSTVDAQFCWSFDEQALALTGSALIPKGDTPVVSDAALSPPQAMLAVLAADAGYLGGVQLTLPVRVRRLRCEADLFFESIDTKTDDVLLLDQDWKGSAYARIPQVTAQPNGAGDVRVQLKFGVSPQIVDLGNIAVGSWQHFALESELVAGQWVVRGQAGGATGAFDGGPNDDDASLPDFDRVFWGLGTLGRVNWRVRYDNLVCRWE